MPAMWTIYESPVGPLTLVGGSRGLSRLFLPGHGARLDPDSHDPGAHADAVIQLKEYFAGHRRRFDLDLALEGTPFQRAVWEQLAAIPHGETRAYGALARAIGRPDHARAVGGAVARTPVPIIVPCHRALGANGELTGYLGGLPLKRVLLDLEATVSGRRALPPAPAGRPRH